VKKSYVEIYNFVRTQFDALTAFQEYDDLDERKSLAAGARSFTTMCEEKQKDQQADMAPLPTVPDSQVYHWPATDLMLAAQFKGHLQIIQAWVYIL
jgi:hypothetical protein